MQDDVRVEAPRIFPTLRYRDAKAMIEWLERAFGFVRHAVHEQDGQVVHAQLAFGSAILMLGSAHDDEFGRHVAPPQPGAPQSQGVYVAVDDVDAHHDRAVTAGADVVMALADQSYGSRDYSCRDPEGYVWSFGTYWPKAHETPPEG